MESEPLTERIFRAPSLVWCNSDIATVTLQRPTKAHRLSQSDLHTLIAHCESIQQQPQTRVVVLKALPTPPEKPPVFCAGYDIAALTADATDANLFERMVQAWAALKPITVVALSGSVYGGATDWALACDIRVGLAGTHWRMPAAALGLHYYPSGLQRYVAHLGLSAAKQAFLTGLPIAAEKLAAWGVLADAVAAADFDEALNRVVNAAASLAPQAAQATKQSLNQLALAASSQAAQPGLWTLLRERERSSQQGAELAEGLAAFQAGRKPEF